MSSPRVEDVLVRHHTHGPRERWEALLGRRGAVQVIPDLLTYPGVLVAHNAVFDLGVLCELWRTWPHEDSHRFCPEWALSAVFDRLDRGDVSDTAIRERLIRLAMGEFEYIERPDGPVRRLDALVSVTARYFGKVMDDAKKTKTKSMNPGDPLPEDATTTDPNAPWRLRYYQLDGTPVNYWPKDAVDYAIDDASWAVDLYYAQKAAHPDKVDGYPLWDPDDPERVITEKREQRADWALNLMGSWGMRCDPEAAERTVEAWHAATITGQEVAHRMGWIRDENGCIPSPEYHSKRFEKYLAQGGDPDVYTGKRYTKSGKPCSQVKAHLQAAVVAACHAGGVDVPMTAPTENFPQGQVQYGETQLREAGTAMAKCAGFDPDEHPLCQYADTREYAGFDTKYSAILRMGARFPVTSNPNHLVETGRTSWRDPPMQQPPKKGGFRDAFVPRPGHLFVSVDYDAIELVALAQVCLWLGLESRLAEVLRRGEDPHAHTAVELMNLEGVPVPGGGQWTYALFQEVRGGRRFPELRDMVETYRQTAKIANFGFPGGQGPVTMSKNSNLTVEQAERLRYAWGVTYPELLEYLKKVHQSTMLGSFTAQQAVSLRIRGGCGYTDGANTFFQGLVADGAKAAAYALSRECYAGAGPLLGCRPVLFLHDEIIMEVPEERAHECAYAMRDIMVETMQSHTPDVPVTAEPALMRRWLKRAETVIDQDTGRLVPWEPKNS